jgi:tetratricopeptide (TPR) repeat protein
VSPIESAPDDLLTTVVLPQMLAGKLSPDQAWKDGDLTLDGVLTLLEKHIDPWGSIAGKPAVNLRRGLVHLLVAHGSNRLKDLSKVPPRVRLWLADYYGHYGDAKVITLADSIVKEMKLPADGDSPYVPGENSLLYQTVERVAWYYTGLGDFKRASETWLTVEKLHAKTGWWNAFAVLQAARAAKLSGEEAKSQELYLRSMTFKNALVSSAALNDLAQPFIQKSLWDEARKWLEKPVEGEGVQRARVMLWSQLGFVHYQQSNRKQARDYSEKSIAAYETLPANEKNYEALPSYVEGARGAVQWLDRWAKVPLAVLPAQIRLPIKASELVPATNVAPVSDTASSPIDQGPLVFRLSVRSMSDARLEVSTDQPFVRARVVSGDWTGRRKFYSEQEVRVEIDRARLVEAMANLSQKASARKADDKLETGQKKSAPAGAGTETKAAKDAALESTDEPIAMLSILNVSVPGERALVPIRLTPDPVAPAPVTPPTAKPETK